ncbi:MAG: hypothetical protein ABI597_10965 [Gammaproteobacteria bacterium]
MKIKKKDVLIELTEDKLEKFKNTLDQFVQRLSIKKFEYFLIGIFENAGIEGDVVTLEDLHGIRNKIQAEQNELVQMRNYEERTGRTFGTPNRKFSLQDECIIIKMIEMFFPEKYLKKIPDEKMLSAILGVECSIYNPKFSYNFEIKFKSCVEKDEIREMLSQLGVLIVGGDYDRFSNKTVFYLARYGFDNVDDNFDKAYDAISKKSDVIDKGQVDSVLRKSFFHRPKLPETKEETLSNLIARLGVD